MITSLTNEKVKYVRSLYRRQSRQSERSFVIEGVRLLEEAVEAGVALDLVIYNEEALRATERGHRLLDRLHQSAREVYAATSKVIESITGTVTPQGVVATGPFLEWAKPVVAKHALFLVVDGLRDPGNLGTILRTAAAGGVSAVLLSEDSVDLYNPKVMRSAMGAHFWLPSFPDLSWESIGEYLQGVRQVVLAETEAALPYYDVDWSSASALIIGNEARGASEGARRLAGVLASIPMAGHAES
ncbi:MAG: RNA methyltransferase, partial [Chloroflexi bacterium]|nr:RNA methyltransferase [Chloroflexota bacterium]